MQRMFGLRCHRVGLDEVAPLASELVVKRLYDGLQEDMAGALRLVLLGVEVQAAEVQEAVQRGKHAERLALGQHAPKLCTLPGELLPQFVELGIVQTLQSALLVVRQHLAHPEARDALQLLVIELGHTLCRHRSPAQVEALGLHPELGVNARQFSASAFLRVTRVGGAEAADDVGLVRGIRRTNGGGDSATHVLHAVLAALVDALGDCFHGLFHKVGLQAV